MGTASTTTTSRLTKDDRFLIKQARQLADPATITGVKSREAQWLALEVLRQLADRLEQIADGR